MQPLLRPPGGEKTWSAVALLLGGAVSLLLVAMGNAPAPALTLISGLWFLFSGYGVWRNRLWGYWFGLLATAFVAGRLGVLLITDPFEWPRLIYCLCFTWFTVALFMERPRRNQDDRPLISLVLLLRDSRSMDVHTLAQRLSIAWGVPVETAKDKDVSQDENVADKTYVVGGSPIFMIGHQGSFYLVNNFDRPYFEEPDKAAEDCPDLRLKKVIREHRAWLSVDLLRVGQLPDRTQAYRQISHLVAELAGDDCLAVFSPESGHLNIFDASLIDELRSENPLEIFQKITQLPVVGIDGEDPEMLAAVAEARRRWPEFVTAFTKRQPGQNFAVKAPITRHGHTEFIWISVERLDAEQIHGCLDNDPVDLGQLKSGDHVSVPVKDLNDWVFNQGDQVTGLFTTKILLKKQGKQ